MTASGEPNPPKLRSISEYTLSCLGIKTALSFKWYASKGGAYMVQKNVLTYIALEKYFSFLISLDKILINVSLFSYEKFFLFSNIFYAQFR